MLAKEIEVRCFTQLNIGISEQDYWKIGIMEYCLSKPKSLLTLSLLENPSFQYSTIPTFHHSM